MTEAEDPGPGDAPDRDAVRAAYQVLASRYSTTTQFQWQVPAFAMTAEAALLAGVVAANKAGTSLVLAIVAVLLALISPVVTRRYEERLLPTELRLHHTLNLQQRLQRQRFDLNRSPQQLRWELRLVMLAPPSLMLNVALAALSITSVAVALSRY